MQGYLPYSFDCILVNYCVLVGIIVVSWAIYLTTHTHCFKLIYV